MREIRARGGKSADCTRERGANSAAVLVEPLLPWRSLGRQLEMCRSCLNSVCIIDSNHAHCGYGSRSDDTGEEPILAMVVGRFPLTTPRETCKPKLRHRWIDVFSPPAHAVAVIWCLVRLIGLRSSALFFGETRVTVYNIPLLQTQCRGICLPTALSVFPRANTFPTQMTVNQLYFDGSEQMKTSLMSFIVVVVVAFALQSCWPSFAHQPVLFIAKHVAPRVSY